MLKVVPRKRTVPYVVWDGVLAASRIDFELDVEIGARREAVLLQVEDVRGEFMRR